ncbi:MAG: hypothetical protein C4329_10060, partial [Chitinophagaceae bacterium]
MSLFFTFGCFMILKNIKIENSFHKTKQLSCLLLFWRPNPPLMKCTRPLTLLLLAFSLSAQSQFKLPSLNPANNAFKADIQKVIEDYPHQFASLRGKVIEKNPQSVEYASLVKPQGAQESSIMRYSSNKKEVYTWQAVMLATE